jgi:hypothetical protein
MLTPGIVMVAVAAITAVFTLHPRLIRAPLWRATVTPLASIIGSGFLVAGPILGHTAGNWAWLAMLALCAAAYLFGAAIRRNILLLEPMLHDGAPKAILVLERCSDFALAFAYFVSVAFYLNLLASFALRGFGIIDADLTRGISTAIIASIGVLGVTRGLGALENVEEGAVGLKLGLIAGLLAALIFAATRALTDQTFALPPPHNGFGLHETGVLLGLVILVQGFETSRYLGDAYDPATRIKTMRYAQLLSSAIYVAFILLVTPYLLGRLPTEGGETGIIDMLAPLGIVVAPLIILAALASQLSAAVADMNGAGGLIADATMRRLSMRAGYAVTAAVAIAITWAANIYEIIVFASKAFVIYYGLQCGLAALVALRPGTVSRAHALLFAFGALLSAVVLVFGAPAVV